MEQKLKRNVSLKAIEAIVTIAASFLQLCFIARCYPPAEVGQYQLILAWLYLVTAASCFGGIVMVATRELSRCNPADERRIFSAALTLQIIVGIVLTLVCIPVFYQTTYFSALALPLIIGTVTLLCAMILQLSQALLISKERISSVVLGSIVGHLVATCAVIIAASQKLSVGMLVVAWAIYNVVNGAVLLYQTAAWRLVSIKDVTISEVRQLARDVSPILLMVIATHLYVRLDVIMLGVFINPGVVAQYSVGYLFLDQLMILSNFMIGALFPNFSRACISHGRDYQVLYHGILKLFLKYLVPIALLIAIFSKSLLGAIYGLEYAASWGSLSVLMLAALFAWLNGPSGTIFISLNKQHINMWATFLSLMVNAVCNLVLIPAIGAIGAAVSTVLTEAALCSFCLWFIYQETKYLPWRRPSGVEGAKVF